MCRAWPLYKEIQNEPVVQWTLLELLQFDRHFQTNQVGWVLSNKPKVEFGLKGLFHTDILPLVLKIHLHSQLVSVESGYKRQRLYGKYPSPRLHLNDPLHYFC